MMADRPLQARFLVMHPKLRPVHDVRFGFKLRGRGGWSGGWLCPHKRKCLGTAALRQKQPLADSKSNFRGRDASYLAPPAQIRTGPIRAYGLYGAFFVKEASRHFCGPSSFHSFVRPAPQAFFRPDRTFASPSRAAAVKDGASSAPPKACPWRTRARRQAA